MSPVTVWEPLKLRVLVAHPSIAEAAVVGYPHDIKGTAIFAYVQVNQSAQDIGSEILVDELKQSVRKAIGPIATPEALQFVSGLPKTRSGKIMRRILRKIAASEYSDLGDVTTLADPAVVDSLIEGHRSR